MESVLPSEATTHVTRKAIFKRSIRLMVMYSIIGVALSAGFFYLVILFGYPVIDKTAHQFIAPLVAFLTVFRVNQAFARYRQHLDRGYSIRSRLSLITHLLLQKAKTDSSKTDECHKRIRQILCSYVICLQSVFTFPRTKKEKKAVALALSNRWGYAPQSLISIGLMTEEEESHINMMAGSPLTYYNSELLTSMHEIFPPQLYRSLTNEIVGLYKDFDTLAHDSHFSIPWAYSILFDTLRGWFITSVPYVMATNTAHEFSSTMPQSDFEKVEGLGSVPNLGRAGLYVSLAASATFFVAFVLEGLASLARYLDRPFGVSQMPYVPLVGIGNEMVKMIEKSTYPSPPSYVSRLSEAGKKDGDEDGLVLSPLRRLGPYSSNP
mmetsp:Transcript_14539/g.37101  ORF Transcript_14539/g.37101 Transcript_14539/m.37101 type:complete len:379 (-) Transcript_14539:434-1570(-)